MKTKSLIIAGDPIRDIYVSTKDGKTTSYEERCGGASNTYRNASSILGSRNTLFLPSFMDLNSIYKIVRVNSKEEIHLCKADDKTEYYKQYFSFRSIASIERWTTEDSAIVFSDYNKGVLNNSINFSTLNFNPIRFLVADTKYRSLNLNYLKLAKQTFWRCTGSEYSFDFAKNFDYTIWTNAKSPVWVFNKQQEVVFVVDFEPIEDSKVIDTCGAGDTFTAAFSSYLFASEKINLKTIKKAILFSLQCCQQVIQIDKTAITTHKIYQFDKGFIQKQ